MKPLGNLKIDKRGRTILVVLSGIVLSVTIYFLVMIGIDCCISLYKKYAPDYRRDIYFGRTLWLYYKYQLIWMLLFANIFLSLCRKKAVNRAILYVMYTVITGSWWMYLFTDWPFRAVPVLVVLTACYILDVFALNWLIKKMTIVSK